MEYSEIFRFIYLIGAVNAIFFAILIFWKTKRSSADVMLGIWLLVLSVQVLIPFIYLMDMETTMKMSGYESAILAYHSIFLYNYIILITGEGFSIKRILKNFLPAFILTVYFIFVLIDLTGEERAQMMNNSFDIPLKLWGAFLGVLFCIEIYLGLSFIKLKRHKKKVLQLYSYRDNIDLFWLWKLLLTFSIIYASVMSLAVVFYFLGTPVYFSDFIFYGLLVVFIFFLGFWGWQQGSISSNENDVAIIDVKNYKINSGANNDNNIEKSDEGIMVEQIMKKRQLFLNQSLSLNDLANETNLQPHQLSRIIHREFNTNFFEFVNKQRVEHFKTIANHPKYQHYTILAIAFECGFNSKSSFNRIFKEYTGITPGEYRNKTSLN